MEERDVAQIALLERECFSSPWSEQMVVEELANPCAHYLIAECDGKFCGYVGIHTILDEGYITNIAVPMQFRRKGIACALLERLILQMKELAFITLEVRISNTPAISLYEKLDFERVGVRKNYYTKPVEDALLMTRYKGRE